jgi:plastocyanin
MRKLVLGSLAFAFALPGVAGDIHGKVACKGVKDCADAVVYVDAVPGKSFPPGSEHVTMNQKNLKFSPRVLPVVVGTTVDFLNADPVHHNVFSPDKCADRMNLGTWPQGEKRSHTFDKPCAASLLCITHPEMEGWIVAVSTPYFSVASADGSFQVRDVPDGSLTVKVWHPKLKSIQKTIAVQGPTEVSFELGP